MFTIGYIIAVQQQHKLSANRTATQDQNCWDHNLRSWEFCSSVQFMCLMMATANHWEMHRRCSPKTQVDNLLAEIFRMQILMQTLATWCKIQSSLLHRFTTSKLAKSKIHIKFKHFITLSFHLNASSGALQFSKTVCFSAMAVSSSDEKGDQKISFRVW